MSKRDLLVNEIDRMEKKRESICVELSNGFDWMLLESLNCIHSKIIATQKRLDEINNA